MMPAKIVMNTREDPMLVIVARSSRIGTATLRTCDAGMTIES